tara:strand:- start:48 stop:293 length:246 start_codon:yes stop_codon:yes gene_type:complete
MKTLRERLKLSVVKFAYLKKNGETRYATGTTNTELLDVVFDIKLKPFKEEKQRDGITTYFDVEKRNWRSLRDDSLIEIINK